MSGMIAGGWTDLGTAKLQSSGLTLDIGRRLGMKEIASAMQLHANFDARPALVIPYHDLTGGLAAVHPKWPNFFRIRYLEKGKDFKALAAAKEQRYAQPPNSGVCAYFPITEKWSKLAGDTKTPLIITEGELKAAAACLIGFPTIGLGGVWNFRNTNAGHFFLPELEKIDWARRRVDICFDSDYADKPQVCHAINALAEELEERGADVHVLLLPNVGENEKTGLDDYFLEKNADDFNELLAGAEKLGISKTLWRMNKTVLYVEDPGLIIMGAGQKMAPGQFKEHSKWSTASTLSRKIAPDGGMITQKVPASVAWLKWPMRKSVVGITYAPGEPQITEGNEYNQWPGWGCKPVKGDTAPFTKLCEFLFKDMEPTALGWFYDWLAYPIQNPGHKMFCSILVFGVVQGTGKSLVGYIMGQVYGKNFKEINDKHIAADFNSWAENKQFILGDEITGSDNRQHANALKRLITQRSVEINVKHLPQYTVPDCINYYFTSNHPDAFFLEDTDRRNLVVEVKGDPLPEEFYKSLDKWLWDEHGPSAVFYWLLNRRISKDFNPAAPAPYTTAKERMILSGKGDMATWINDLMRHPEQYLYNGKMKYTRDMFTSKEVLRMYEVQSGTPLKVTASGINRALVTAGAQAVADGKPLRAADGTMGRYLAVRNIAKWAKCKSRKDLEKNIAMQPIPTRGE